MVIKNTTVNKILIAIISIIIAGIIYKHIVYKYQHYTHFNWQVAVLAEKDKPMQVHNEYHFRYGLDTDDIFQDGFDDISFAESGRSIKSKLPGNFEIEWFSYTENKFYKADVKLPEDTLNQIGKELREELHERYAGRGIDINYLSITLLAELKNEGGITIWLSNGKGNYRKICDGKAVETELVWEKFYPDCKYDRQMWTDIVLQKANWKIQVILPSPSNRLYELNAKTYSGVFYCFLSDEEYTLTPDRNSVVEKPIPRYIIAEWKNAQGKRFSLRLFFKDYELLNGFKELYAAGNNEEPSEIILIINNDFTNTDVVLKKDDKEINLTQIIGHDDIVEYAN